MAKFKDKNTGNVLETTNDFVAEQYRKNPQRYVAVGTKDEPDKKKDGSESK